MSVCVVGNRKLININLDGSIDNIYLIFIIENRFTLIDDHFRLDFNWFCFLIVFDHPKNIFYDWLRVEFFSGSQFNIILLPHERRRSSKQLKINIFIAFLSDHFFCLFLLCDYITSHKRRTIFSSVFLSPLSRLANFSRKKKFENSYSRYATFIANFSIFTTLKF